MSNRKKTSFSALAHTAAQVIPADLKSILPVGLTEAETDVVLAAAGVVVAEKSVADRVRNMIHPHSPESGEAALAVAGLQIKLQTVDGVRQKAADLRTAPEGSKLGQLWKLSEAIRKAFDRMLEKSKKERSPIDVYQETYNTVSRLKAKFLRAEDAAPIDLVAQLSAVETLCLQHGAVPKKGKAKK